MSGGDLAPNYHAIALASMVDHDKGVVIFVLNHRV
jgi:hypothetical protein